MEPSRCDNKELVIGRRSHSRLRVRLPARLTTLDGTSHAILTDLSFGGAKVLLNCEVQRGQEAVLAWHRFEAFGNVTWSQDGMCGLVFEEFLEPKMLLETRDLHDADHLPSDRELTRDVARGWVEGRHRL